MKKAVYAAAFVFMLLFAAQAFALELPPAEPRVAEVTEKSIAEKLDNLTVEGGLPAVTLSGAGKFQTELNALIRQEYTDRLEAAKNDPTKKIEFSYEVVPDGEYYSIVLKISTVSVSTRDEVRTFVFGAADKLLTVNDVLGPNGVKIINKVIADEMSLKPGTYNPDFAGITEDQSFYIENGSVFVIFDKYALGPAALGTPSFEVNIAGVRNNTFTIGKNDSYPKDPFNVKMIPLRTVAAGLGFGLIWESRTLSIEVTRDNATVASLAIGKNTYFKNKHPAISLEFAPELDANSVTHLPISFFERILDACYTVDQAGSITFSYYAPPSLAKGIQKHEPRN